MTESPTCKYCGRNAKLVTGEEVYPARADLWDRKIWLCEHCDAYVGCHEGTEEPYGELANAQCRYWRMKAREAFDPLWKKKMRTAGWGKKKARKAAYEWLSEELGISASQCHMGNFDEDRCKEVVEICSR